ncbi:ATP-grasp domain-containing protein [Streptomyces beigongshangae]|uniref:ATP-grasp domain-containing protein n=1 Tax=Streptomyces beigongshangae TaxID=2841597 RepID=UPI001C843422|nr:ATP-grasp domain-containing protein [Streptomyces sp. REN17]
MTGITDAFVQLGATRDGLDSYLECAKRRAMPAVLVDTPAMLKWRQRLRRHAYDVEIPVTAPEDTEQVAAALHAARIAPALTLAGFDRYVQSAFRLAARERIPPWPHCGTGFTAPDKAAQRMALAVHAPAVPQPGYARVQVYPDRHEPAAAATTGNRRVRAPVLEALTFPQVVKPVDGAGGIGVFLVRDVSQREHALRAVSATCNYGGAAFAGVLVEECVKGTEYSLQCLAWEGTARVLSVCEKIVLLDGAGALRGFREAGHIALPGTSAPQALHELAQSCLDASGYREGPFHVDLIHNVKGPHFLEMGFRLSGFGLVTLVERATGIQWAEAAFAAHLERRAPQQEANGTRRVAGQFVATDPRQLARAHELAARRPGVLVRPSPAAPSEDGFSAHELESLASDRQRHATILGRVTLEGDSKDEVRALLRHCVTV